MTVILLTLVMALLAAVAGLFVLSLTASEPEHSGPQNGRLAACPTSPNCVSTQSDDREHWIAPLNFNCPVDQVIPLLRSVLERMPRTKIVEESESYLRAEFRSSVFQFVDDVEFLVERESARVHFRSASRTGYADLGVNRARMDDFRRRFADACRQASSSRSTAANR